MYAVTTRNLTRRFGKLTAVNNLNLKVPEKSLYGLIGPNGAGKTTTLRMLAGLLEPSDGEIRINDLPIRSYWREIQWQIGFMPDFFGVYEDLLVWEYLDFFARTYKLGPQRRVQIVDELLESGRPGKKARRLCKHAFTRDAPAAVPGARPGPRSPGAAAGRARFRVGPARPGGDA